MAEAIALAKELNDMHGLAVALNYAAVLGYLERNPAEVACLATDLIELSTRQNFALWLAYGAVFRGWARSASGNMAEGISWIQDGSKKRARQEDVDSDYLFGNCLQRPAFRPSVSVVALQS
jgi:hypothetical protein